MRSRVAVRSSVAFIAILFICFVVWNASAPEQPADPKPDVELPRHTEWIEPDQRPLVRCLDVRFTDQDGRTGAIGELVDRPVLVTFFYTRCQNNSKCSAVVSRLASLQRAFQRGGLADGVNILAITFEPQFDTPERVQRFAMDRGLRFDRSARAILLDETRHEEFVTALQTPVNFNAGWVNTHGIQLTLLDAQGRLVRQYRTLLWDEDQVVTDVRRVLTGG